jgi:hypothetical protein
LGTTAATYRIQPLVFLAAHAWEGPAEVVSPGCVRQAAETRSRRLWTATGNDSIANDNVQGSGVVTLERSDEGFASTGCGGWSWARHFPPRPPRAR